MLPVPVLVHTSEFVFTWYVYVYLVLFSDVGAAATAAACASYTYTSSISYEAFGLGWLVRHGMKPAGVATMSYHVRVYTRYASTKPWQVRLVDHLYQVYKY